MADLAAADQVAAVYAWLRDHLGAQELLGGAGHVSGIAEAPWPHVVVADGPGGDLRGLVWSTELEVTLEVLGSPNGAPGKAALRALAVKLAQVVCELPDAPVVDASVPVVSNVIPSGVFAWSPLANGQPRYLVGLLVTIRPPLA